MYTGNTNFENIKGCKMHMLSVIIPVYNSSKYLRECIDSVLNQSYKKFEVILVDDGSTDKSVEICDDYAKKYHNIKTVHINNSGSFQARKVGVQLADGEVITFIDADDWIDDNAYEELMNIYNQYLPDIILFSYQVENKGSLSENYYRDGLYDSEKIEKDIINGMMYDCKIGGRKINPHVGCKLFKKSIFEEVTSDIIKRVGWGDDALVTYPAISLAQSLYINNIPYYHYRINETSQTHNFNTNNLIELTNFYNCITYAFEKVNKKNYFKFQIESYMRSFIDMMSINCWGIHSCGSMYRFPYELIEKKSKVQIYGAGVVGKSYVYELLHDEYADLVGWYDKNYIKLGAYAGIPIQNPEEIVDKNCDIIIAIEDENIVNQIRNYLNNMNIKNENIKWKKPLKVF